MRNLITLNDVSSAEIERIFSITEDLKTKCSEGLREPLLPGRVLALLFEKPSLRTRVSFEAGMAHLGGKSVFLGDDVGFGTRESIEDFGRVLSEYVDAIAVRAKYHHTVEELASVTTCSVINGLTDMAHPCQALADLYTLREFYGDLAGKHLVFVGDGNNVALSLARACGKLGLRFTLAAPAAYQFSTELQHELRASISEEQLRQTSDAVAAVRDADAIYTDVWASMGQEKERAARLHDFAGYQVNAELMANAPDYAIFMHCLPARRGEEVTDDVIDSAQSCVVAQAGNRMHVQKGVLAWLLGAQG